MPDSVNDEIAALTPMIRRYCARMLNSIFDGDDVAQDALANALTRQHLLKDGANIKAWVFRIAHNKCIDFLRYQNRWQSEDTSPLAETMVTLNTDAALEHLVLRLPPRQRAMVLLKEVFGFSLAEVGSAMMCSVDSVKSGLNRARASLADQSKHEEQKLPDESTFQLIKRYAEYFHLGDWDGVLSMIHEEVELDVATIYCGIGADKVLNRYCTNYSRFEFPWAAEAASLPSGLCVLTWRCDQKTPQIIGAARLKFREDKIITIQDFLHDQDMMDLVTSELTHAGIENYYPSMPATKNRIAPAIYRQ